MVVVVVVLLVTVEGCGVVAVVDGVDAAVALREGMLMAGFLVLVVESIVAVVSFTEAVVVSCRGDSGGT